MPNHVKTDILRLRQKIVIARTNQETPEDLEFEEEEKYVKSNKP